MEGPEVSPHSPLFLLKPASTQEPINKYDYPFEMTRPLHYLLFLVFLVVNIHISYGFTADALIHSDIDNTPVYAEETSVDIGFPSNTSDAFVSRASRSTILNRVNAYWNAWREQNVNKAFKYIASNSFVLISQQTGRRATSLSALKKIWDEEWGAYETKNGKLALTYKVLKLEITADAANGLTMVTYWLDVKGGVKWGFTDAVFVHQFFNAKNEIVYHADSWGGDYDPTAKGQSKARNTFQFDFAYPVKNLARSSSFYDAFLGPPELRTASTRVYDLDGHRFTLDKSRLGGLAIPGGQLPSGYAEFIVSGIQKYHKNIQSYKAGSKVLTKILRKSNGDPYFIASDTNGNVFVVKEVEPSVGGNLKGPVVKTANGVHTNSRELTYAWIKTNKNAFQKKLDSNVKWYTDTSIELRKEGILKGRSSIAASVQKDWARFDRNSKSGLSIQVHLSEPVSRKLGKWNVLSYRQITTGRGPHPFKKTSWVTHVFQGSKLVTFTDIRSKLYTIGNRKTPMVVAVGSLAYPVTNIKKSKAFYEKTLGLRNTYTDSSWVGFWSVSAVFGIFRTWPRWDGIPRAGQTNAYVSLWTRNANNAYKFLKSKKRAFPRISAINNKKGIDKQDGYIQVVTTDMDNSVLVFTEYT